MTLSNRFFYASVICAVLSVILAVIQENFYIFVPFSALSIVLLIISEFLFHAEVSISFRDEGPNIGSEEDGNE